jgi:hypothetical protein
MQKDQYEMQKKQYKDQLNQYITHLIEFDMGTKLYRLQDGFYDSYLEKLPEERKQAFNKIDEENKQERECMIKILRELE